MFTSPSQGDLNFRLSIFRTLQVSLSLTQAAMKWAYCRPFIKYLAVQRACLVMRKHDFLLFLLFIIFSSLPFGSSAQDCQTDTEPPSFEVLSPVLQVFESGDTAIYQCGEQEIFLETDIAWSDNCDTMLNVTYSKGINVGDCLQDGFMVSIDYCWAAIDESGNSNQFCLVVVITDTVPPTFDQYPADLNLDLTAGDVLPPADTLVASDFCHGFQDVIFEEVSIPDADSCGFTLLRTWTAVDDCGNEVAHQQTINANDFCTNCPTNLINNLSVGATSCGFDNGSLSVEVPGDISEYSFSLSPSLGSPSGNGIGVTDLPPGDYQLNVSHNSIPNCDTTVTVNIPVSGCTDTVSVSIEGTEEFCLDENILDFDGAITSVAFCDQGDPNTVLGAMTDSLCLTLEPANGFVGTSPDLICLVHCFENDPAQCDTTYIEVTVLDCELQIDSLVISPETCAGNDGSIMVFASGGTGLKFSWSTGSTVTNSASGLSNSNTYSVTVSDDLGCEAVATDITIGYDCPTPTTEVISLVHDCDDGFLSLCANMDELQGNYMALNICQPANNGTLAAANDTCYFYQPESDFEGVDTVCLVICDDLSMCDTFIFEIDVTPCPAQAPCATIPDDTLVVVTDQCDDEVKFCIGFDLGQAQLYDFLVSGEPYGGNISICEFDTLVSYGFLAIPGNGLDGPYEVTSWLIGGTSVGSGTFEDIYELVDLMNMLDPNGFWTLDSITFNISSFNTLTDYGLMTILQTQTSDIANLNLNSATAPIGSALYLPVGEHEVILNHQELSYCVDTFTAIVHCSLPQVLFDTISVGVPDTFCYSANLPGEIEDVELTCLNCDNLNAELLDTCIILDGSLEGTDSLLIVSCDELGLCDSAWLIVFVANDGQPIANMDNDTTFENTRVVIDILANDFVNGDLKNIWIILDPQHGYAEISTDFTVSYTPDEDFCGFDAFAYVICNEVGCDTTTVDIVIQCSRPIIYDGFSPNNDGQNDYFTILNIEQYPGNELMIFNRWGNLVYQKTNYDNTWEGYNYDNQKLPDGTYFYLLDLGSGEPISGPLQLNR